MKKVRSWVRVLLACPMVIASGAVCAADVRVAVASNLLLPLKSLAREYERASGDTLRISAGSTGKLYAQIVNGAPFEVFLAANAREPGRLEAAGLGVAGSRFTYAVGRLVLWGPAMQDAPQDMVAVLKAGDFRRLALANPVTAPYGAAALEVLDHLGLKDQLQAKLIKGENISQAYQYVASGAAELGFVALSQLKAQGDDGRGKYWTIDGKLYAPIRQEALLLKPGEASPAAKRLLTFLQSAPGRKAIEQFGYGLE